MTIGAAAMNVAQTVNTQSSTAQAATSSDTDFKSIMKTSMAAGAKNTVSGSRSNTDSQINLKKTSVMMPQKKIRHLIHRTLILRRHLTKFLIKQITAI